MHDHHGFTSRLCADCGCEIHPDHWHPPEAGLCPACEDRVCIKSVPWTSRLSPREPLMKEHPAEQTLHHARSALLVRAARRSALPVPVPHATPAIQPAPKPYTTRPQGDGVGLSIFALGDSDSTPPESHQAEGRRPPGPCFDLEGRKKEPLCQRGRWQRGRMEQQHGKTPCRAVGTSSTKGLLIQQERYRVNELWIQYATDQASQ